VPRSMGRLLALLTNINTARKNFPETNTLAYFALNCPLLENIILLFQHRWLKLFTAVINSVPQLATVSAIVCHF
jgi:hypothetical protein